MIEVQSLCKSYGAMKAVDAVDFVIRPGEVVGLLGPNGAGKTTIMKMLTCYHYPDSGAINIFGFNAYEDETAIKGILGYLPENAPHYPEFKVSEYLDFVAEARIGKGKTPSGLSSRQAVDKALELCSLGDVRNKLIEQLSKGYKQRLGLAQAILHEPQLLILDEPTTGLDPNQILEIRKLIRDLSKDRTIILSTHILQEVEAVCDRVMILNKGKIVAQGSSQEIADELRGEAVFELVVQDGENILASLKSLPMVRKIEEDRLLASAMGEVPPGAAALQAYRIRVNRDQDGVWSFRSAVAAVIRTTGGIMCHFATKSASLEDLFVRLTGKEDEHGKA